MIFSFVPLKPPKTFKDILFENRNYSTEISFMVVIYFQLA